MVAAVCLVAAVVLLGFRQPAPRAERMTLLVPVTSEVRPAPSPTAPPRMGEWTPQLGQQIVRRAARWLGWPYSFGAGGVDGPSYGHPVDADSRHDDRVEGFDCSGLTMYALGPWRTLSHSAAAQYREAGSFHPSLEQLQPGDLIFWSANGTVDGIGHVAVYAGNGQVIQAPRSGARITVTPLYDVERAAMGATRPMT